MAVPEQPQNAGEQTGYGMEFEVNWSLTDNLTIVQ